MRFNLIWKKIGSAGHRGGANFGWHLREAEHETPKVGGESPDGAIDPVYEYVHGTKELEGLSVTGGYVYRGAAKSLQGRYVFADYQNRRVWSFVLENGKAARLVDHTQAFTPKDSQLGLIASFGEDAAGELYLACFDGAVLKVVEH